LLSIGILTTWILTWILLPRLWHRLPHDHGKALVPGGELSKGKPTGAGIILSLVSLVVMVFVVPPDWSVWGVIATLMGAMYFGYADDASKVPWGQLKKGLLDFACSLAAAFCVCHGEATPIWVPLFKGTILLSPYIYIPCATLILLISINAMNCSDGVDGLAGSLGLISLLSLAALLYLVLGYKPVADYLLLPHYPDSAKWAIMAATIAGSFGGYLWYNAEPSKVLMGDAGSRMLGLAIGVAVLATGNPLLILVFAPMVLANGGTGLVKILLLRFFRKLGFDTTPTNRLPPEKAAEQLGIIKEMHKVRFPLHDHCRKNLGWTNAQVLMRFVLIQSLLIPFLFALFTKVR
jgi:phospho-N-acetylmuramoyl-pentapeptide-transferase